MPTRTGCGSSGRRGCAICEQRMDLERRHGYSDPSPCLGVLRSGRRGGCFWRHNVRLLQRTTRSTRFSATALTECSARDSNTSRDGVPSRRHAPPGLLRCSRLQVFQSTHEYPSMHDPACSSNARITPDNTYLLPFREPEPAIRHHSRYAPKASFLTTAGSGTLCARSTTSCARS